MSVNCIEKWLNGVLDHFEKDGTGVHLDRLRAVSTLRGYYAGQYFQLLLDLPFALLFLTVVGFLGGLWTAGCILAISMVFLIIISFTRRRYSINRKRQKMLGDRRYNFLVEALSGVHTIKAISLEEQMLRRHERLEAEVAKSDFDVISVGNLPVSLGGIFSQLILFTVLFVGGTQAIQGYITLGSLAACTLLSGRFFQPIRKVAAFWVRHADIEIALTQIQQIEALRQESDVSAPCLPDEILGRIRLENLSFRYNEHLPWVANAIDLEVNPKEMVCLRHRGSHGTTTLLNLIYGLVIPTEGRVYIDGIDMAEICHNNFKGRIEFIPQQGTLFSGTIFDNLTLFNPAYREASLDAAALLGLDEVVSELPLGYETQVGARLYEFLSTGIIQRICLARALTIRPRILLLDKVNDSMDSESDQLFFWLLGKLKGCCTIIIVTSDPRIISLSDRVYHLVDGVLIKEEAERC